MRCSLPGKFQKEFNLKKDKLYKLDIACVGDFVEIEMNDDGTGVIQSIREKKNYISRKAPRIKGASRRGERLEQVIASNINNICIVTSVKSPSFNHKMVDRLIVAGESAHVKVILVINKIDLDKNDSIAEWKALYESLGYPVILTSTLNMTGIEEVKRNFEGSVSLLWGQSGVGKSSLLNTMYPDLELKTGEISTFTNKGTHTTVTSVLIPVEESTFVIDTPGVREIDPYGIKEEDLCHYFIEFAPYINECRFNTCTHSHEPGCAVVEAVEQNKISAERYESYINLLNTIEDDMIF